MLGLTIMASYSCLLCQSISAVSAVPIYQLHHCTFPQGEPGTQQPLFILQVLEPQRPDNLQLSLHMTPIKAIKHSCFVNRQITGKTLSKISTVHAHLGWHSSLHVCVQTQLAQFNRISIFSCITTGSEDQTFVNANLANHSMATVSRGVYWLLDSNHIKKSCH